ncbi:hypothetical protein GQ600_256 [Phytophthora cactorum]|nr:hypothetical protein GQ600_256 [Phytophthora cactorum]
MWSGFGRSDVPHLTLLITGWRLRGPSKDVLKSTMTLDECVDTLTFLQSIAEIEYAKRITDVGHMGYRGADAELERLVREVSQYVYQLIEKGYRAASDRSTFYTIRDVETELLPCRHVICWRLISNKSPIPVKHINPRWSLTSPLNLPVKEASLPLMMLPDHKLRTAYDVRCRIADIMSRNGTPVYLNMLEALRIFEDVVKDGEIPPMAPAAMLRTESKLYSESATTSTSHSDSVASDEPSHPERVTSAKNGAFVEKNDTTKRRNRKCEEIPESKLQLRLHKWHLHELL